MLRKFTIALTAIMLSLNIASFSQQSVWTTFGNDFFLEDPFLGTKNKKPLSIRTDKTERLFINYDGRISSNNTWWGINAEPDQYYRLTIGGNIKSEGITTNSLEVGTINNPTGGLALKTKGETKLNIASNGQIYSDDKNWWYLGVYPNQLQHYRLRVKDGIRTDFLSADSGRFESINPDKIFISTNKDLIFKTNQKEYMRMYGEGQGMSIPVFVGIGKQPDGVHQLNVGGTAKMENATIQSLTVSNNLSLKNGNNSIISASNSGLIRLNGWVGINTDPEQDYRLAINGKVICEEVRVDLKTNWPDYVFDKSYDLMPLKDVENYIAANQHLPGIPSAKEIEQKGIEIGNMQATLLQKIEELTLHMIELKKENELFKQKLEALSK